MVDCACGRELSVPSLAVLREGAGLTSYEIAPEAKILGMLERGELPARTCVDCGRTESPVLPLFANCEQAHSSETSGGGGLAAIGVAAIVAGWFYSGFFREDDRGGVVSHGRVTDVPVPTSLCVACSSAYDFTQRDFGLMRIGRLLLIGGVILLPLYGIVGAGLAAGSFSAFAIRSAITARRQRRLKSLVQKTPIYAELLARFPDATIVPSDT
jgi:hypothetical protein